MSARGNLVLKDRTTPTPVDHTFSPDGDNKDGVHLYSEKSGVPAGNPRFTAQLRYTKGRYRATLRLAVPIVQTKTESGISSPVVVRTGYVEVSTTFADTSTAQERADAFGLMANAMASTQTQVNDLVVNLSDIW